MGNRGKPRGVPESPAENLLPTGSRRAARTTSGASVVSFTGGAVIMAGSGMCTGGRVRHQARAEAAGQGAKLVVIAMGVMSYRG